MKPVSPAGACPKVAVVAPNWLGDAVMSLPAIDLLSRGGAVVAVLCAPYVARVFWGVDGVDELWVDAAGGRWRRIASRVGALRAFRADAAVLLAPSFSSALPAFIAGVRPRLGFASDGRRPLLTASLGAPSRRVHLAASYERLAREALGLLGRPDAGRESPPPRLCVSENERADAVRLLAGAGVPAGGYVVVVPGAAFGPTKEWPRERYRALCERLARETHVVVCGGASDRAACAEIAHGVSGACNLAGATSLGQFFAVVEAARALVANDSGAAHVAAALDVPVVALFGSTSPAWTAPIGRRVEIVQHQVHCNPCYLRACPTQLECFHGIEVEAVHARVGALLRDAPVSSRHGAGRSDRIGRAGGA